MINFDNILLYLCMYRYNLNFIAFFLFGDTHTHTHRHVEGDRDIDSFVFAVYTEVLRLSVAGILKVVCHLSIYGT